MVQDKTMKISKVAHQRLTDYKERFGHKSYDSAIRELISDNQRLEATTDE